MQTLDNFEIRINRSFPPWTLGKGLCVAEIYINNQSLIELVRRLGSFKFDREQYMSELCKQS